MNYLTSATGTTGTASTNIVFSTSPTLLTPTIIDLIGSNIYPSVDSTTAIQILKADAATAVITVDTTNSMVGFGTTTPSAYVTIKGGTTTIAPLKLTSGTNLTTAEAGAVEFNGTNLFFSPIVATRHSVLTTPAANVVSPTAPNRTLTVVVDGVTYYIAAKTTND